jgi:hypothetical protein
MKLLASAGCGGSRLCRSSSLSRGSGRRAPWLRRECQARRRCSGCTPTDNHTHPETTSGRPTNGEHSTIPRQVACLCNLDEQSGEARNDDERRICGWLLGKLIHACCVRNLNIIVYIVSIVNIVSIAQVNPIEVNLDHSSERRNIHSTTSLPTFLLGKSTQQASKGVNRHKEACVCLETPFVRTILPS